MRVATALPLMDEFAKATGLLGNRPPRRYLWTDAYAVSNYLSLHRATGDDRHLQTAIQLVDQVHHVLGRHRADDHRQGWLSGLPDSAGEQHPTSGGLRIGKKLPERTPEERFDDRLEWDRDGQYFHYLTKWMHALYGMSRATTEHRYLKWAEELAIKAHREFVYHAGGGAKRMFWKMSIDLRRPLVASMGHHDPLDGLITCLELHYASDNGNRNLTQAIEDFDEMCATSNWESDDPLGIGGLLDAAARLAYLIFERGAARHQLLDRMLRQAACSLQRLGRSTLFAQLAHYRLAFRELGLSIGLRELESATPLLAHDRNLAQLSQHSLAYRSLCQQIEDFWLTPTHRSAGTWIDHEDINTVMLATSLLQ
jgi:hypothetical protein